MITALFFAYITCAPFSVLLHMRSHITQNIEQIPVEEQVARAELLIVIQREIGKRVVGISDCKIEDI